MNNKTHNTTINSYVIGFILSIVLTLAAYIIVTNHLFAGWIIIIAIISLALVQLVVQLYFFLHLGKESKPRWNLVFLLSTIGIILILVVGSIWIMDHLNYNMTPQKVNQYIRNQDRM